ncbi:MAG: translation initiation factor IF-2 [Candidatus Sungbacteria bacterium]|nr:translation initiation factor IF-2 [Candidatus Sungbacteria bacterium]
MPTATVSTTQTAAVIRPPIVVVMGHIDHGKTTLLDWFRKTKVVEGESGGITQHIGAYEVEHEGKRITFIDTPGHEAFSKIRSRGAKAADIAIVVVAADEGVKVQTKEALDIVRQNDLPFVIALNKIDSPNASPERVKQELARENVLVESYGGNVPSVEVSARVGTGMNDLLEILLLLADLKELRVDPAVAGEGVVLEAHRDARRGITGTLLVLNGTLRKGDICAIGASVETIKILEDFRGHAIALARASMPVLVAGLTTAPGAGDPFRVFPNKELAQTAVKEWSKNLVSGGANVSSQQAGSEGESGSRPVFNVIIKADVLGSKEVLEETIHKLDSPLMGVRILKSEVGDINESDVKLAMATKLVTIVGFRVRMDASVRMLADQNHVRIVQNNVIYDMLDAVRKSMEEIIPPVVTRVAMGRVKILKIFKKEGSRQVVGGRVEDGVLKQGLRCSLVRMKEAVGDGKIIQLQHNKADMDSVEKGNECGMLIEMKTSIQEGDILEAFQEEIIRQKLPSPMS